jgi:hypothetical protein
MTDLVLANVFSGESRIRADVRTKAAELGFESRGYSLPAGFSCWPGGSTGVVIPGR